MSSSKSPRYTLTPLIFSKLYRFAQHEFVGICLSIEAVERLQDDCEVSRANIYRTPGRNSFEPVDLWFNVFEMSLSETLDGFTLEDCQHAIQGPS
jgi:hypothetical protein